ncbi:5-oxoprolinase subunit PxpA [Fictibacillus enclensis]|uniref:LamB/YcsF family protein n=1 Tax=Fictibacillus enclensis TaxID=1017270 RepID=UPI0025A10D0C|nr:5-oxoprolinase subunit PxpA [Fictibacillus enclensis]MDM5340609.1 5-oxoprolinase subunit PxpA [Fictibacillus enclensis]
MLAVDLNCDMGESYGLYQMGNDEEMMEYITSANIACGYHGGDPHTMRKTVELAKKYGVAIGSHPGFPDLVGFGRRALKATPEEIRDYVIYQTGALREFASYHSVQLQHCKPHGALYMMAMEDEKIAKAILEGLDKINPELIVFALNNSAVEEVGRKMGMRVALETYADREHTASGSIVMTRAGSQIEDYDAMADRVVRMVKEGKVLTHLNEDASLKSETICIHGDTPGASLLARKISEALKKNEIQVKPINEIL